MQKSLLILITTLSFAVQAAESLDFISKYGPRNATDNYPIETFDINLDLNYEDRWREVMTEKKWAITRLIDLFVTANHLSHELLSSINYEIVSTYDLEFAREVQAIAKLTSLSFENITFLNVIYDVTSFCSSVLVQDADDNIFHGRNLDYPNAAGAPMFFNARYLRGGKVLFEGITKAGALGVTAGMKKGKFALNVNQNVDPCGDPIAFERKVPDFLRKIFSEYIDHYNKVKLSKQNLLRVPSGRKKSGIILARNAMEVAESFEELVSLMSNTPTFKKGYYMVSGVKSGEGAIIAKGIESAEDVMYLDAANGRWHLEVTNYWWVNDDPSCDNRRYAAVLYTDEIGREKITKEILWKDVMMRYPLLNAGTVYSVIMQASTGYFNGTIWGKPAKEGEAFTDLLKELGESQDKKLKAL